MGIWTRASNIRWWNCEICFIYEGNCLLKSASGCILTNDLTDGSPLLLGVHSILWSGLRCCGSSFTDVCCVGCLDMFGFSMLSLRCAYIVKCEVVCHQCIWYTRTIESYTLLYYILQNMLIMTFTIHASYLRIYTIRICIFSEFVNTRSNSTSLEMGDIKI